MMKITDARDVIRMINEHERKQVELEKAGEPQVGIFWLVEKKLLIHGTCWSIAEQVDVFRTSSMGHDRFWRSISRMDKRLKDYPYDFFPRGRVTYDTQNGIFHLFLDRCILKKKSIVMDILKQMCLPPEKTRIETDSHYRCSRCNPEYLSYQEK